MVTLKQYLLFLTAVIVIGASASVYFHAPTPPMPMNVCFYNSDIGCMEIAAGMEEEAFKRLRGA